MQLISGCSFNEARPPPTRGFTAVLPGTALFRLVSLALRPIQENVYKGG